MVSKIKGKKEENESSTMHLFASINRRHKGKNTNVDQHLEDMRGVLFFYMDISNSFQRSLTE